MRVVLAGPGRGLPAALADAGVTVARVEEPIVTGEALEEAGIDDADVYLLTDVAEATSVSVALDRNPDLRVVLYDDETMPEFARAQVDHAFDPALFDPAAVADAIADGTVDRD